LPRNTRLGEKFVRTKDGRIEYAFIGLRHNLDSIKSKARIRLLWVDEAEPVSETAWMKAIPTVREEGSEIWVTWNPERKKSATHKRFRETRRPTPRSWN
jgi:phage terminase large subunit